MDAKIHADIVNTPCTCGEIHREKANYYCTVVDRLANDGSRDRVGLLAGPFGTHRAALVMLPRAEAKAKEVNGRAHWYGFGTVAMKLSYDKPGVLNSLLGIS